MPRVRKGAARARKHKRILKSVRGQIGAASRRYRVALEAWLRAGQYATIGRKLRKRDFRQLWITRLSAACRQRGLTYSRFMHGLGKKGVALNRKMLAAIAVADPGAFDRLVALVRGKAPAEAPKPGPPPAEAKKPEEAPPTKAEQPEEAEAPRKARPARKAAAKPAEAEAEKKTTKKAAPAKKKTATRAKTKTVKKTSGTKTTPKKATVKKRRSSKAKEE